MPQFSKYRIYILCEDRVQYNFIRGFFEDKGVSSRKIQTYKDLPNGAGSGEQFVRDNFPYAITAARKNKEQIIYIVIMDVDPEYSVDDRQRQLNEKLTAEGTDAFSVGDTLMLLLPKRNIETWITWANAASSTEKANMDETRDYKRGPCKAKSSGKKISEIEKKMRQGGSCTCENIPSLILAFKEYKRICERLDSQEAKNRHLYE